MMLKAKDNRGFVSVLTAIIAVALLGFAALSVDMGYYLLKRHQLRNVSDAAALAAVMDINNYADVAMGVINKNPAVTAGGFKLDRGWWDDGQGTFTSDQSGDAVRVSAEQPISLFFASAFGSGVYRLSAGSIAQPDIKGVVTSLGTTVAAIDTNKSTLLNGLLGGLLGTTITIDAVGWQGVADANIDLIKFLELAKAQFGAADTKELLNAQVTLSNIIDLTMALENDATVTAALNGIKNSIQPPLSSQQVKFGDIINVATDYSALAKADMNLLTLLMVSAEVFNAQSAVVQKVSLSLPPLAGLDLKLKVIEAPVVVLAEKGTTIHSAQVRLSLDANVGALLGGVLQVPIYLELGSGSATVAGLGSDNGGWADINATASLTKMFLGKIDGDFFSTTKTFTKDDLKSATILNVLGLVKAEAKSYTDAEGGSGGLNFSPLITNPALPITQSVSGLVGDTVDSLLSSLIGNIEIKVTALGIGLIDVNAVKTEILTALTDTLATALNPLLNTAGEALGVYPGKTDVTVYSAVYAGRIVK